MLFFKGLDYGHELLVIYFVIALCWKVLAGHEGHRMQDAFIVWLGKNARKT